MAEPASVSAFASGTDDLGVYVRVSVDPKIFSETALLKTAYWFTDHYYLFIANNRSAGLIDLELRLKQGQSLEQLEAACGEFCNKLLDQEVRQRVLAETSPIREQLIKKAFFEAKAPVPPEVMSDESQLPQLEQSYSDDPLRAGRRD